MPVYLFIVNALALTIMIFDKYSAEHHLFRIPETTLFGLAAIGGSLGCIGGMYIVRHKTKHLSFVLGMPAILAVQILLAVWYFRR